MSERLPRKRIPYKKIQQVTVGDNLAFIKNKCSDRARKILTAFERIEIGIWFDKHYHNRLQRGDDNGLREGIDSASVEKLVLQSIKYLFLYSAYVDGFTVVNHEPQTFRAIRIVVKAKVNDTMLNVVIETHYIQVNNYEITVKTAMCTNDFRMSDGQYSIELEEDGSILYRFRKGSNIEICAF